jgi:hypothetical protein
VELSLLALAAFKARLETNTLLLVLNQESAVRLQALLDSVVVDLEEHKGLGVLNNLVKVGRGALLLRVVSRLVLLLLGLLLRLRLLFALLRLLRSGIRVAQLLFRFYVLEAVKFGGFCFVQGCFAWLE